MAFQRCQKTSLIVWKTIRLVLQSFTLAYTQLFYLVPASAADVNFPLLDGFIGMNITVIKLV